MVEWKLWHIAHTLRKRVNSEEPHRHHLTQELSFVGQNLLLSSTKFLVSSDGVIFERASRIIVSSYVSRWNRYEAGVHEKNPFVAESTCLANEHADELLSALLQEKKEGSK